MNLSDNQQSILWQCMNPKTDYNLHLSLDEIVKSHSSHTNETLYRGLSVRECKILIKCLMNNEDVDFNRVLSFSSSEKIALDFAGKWVYGTLAIIKINNIDVFNYSDTMSKLILNAPESEYINENRRISDFSLVDEEKEFMIGIGTKFKIIGHEVKEQRELMYQYYQLEQISASGASNNINML